VLDQGVGVSFVLDFLRGDCACKCGGTPSRGILLLLTFALRSLGATIGLPQASRIQGGPAEFSLQSGLPRIALLPRIAPPCVRRNNGWGGTQKGTIRSQDMKHVNGTYMKLNDRAVRNCNRSKSQLERLPTHTCTVAKNSKDTHTATPNQCFLISGGLF
jgi:hypothetical protein